MDQKIAKLDGLRIISNSWRCSDSLQMQFAWRSAIVGQSGQGILKLHERTSAYRLFATTADKIFSPKTLINFLHAVRAYVYEHGGYRFVSTPQVHCYDEESYRKLSVDQNDTVARYLYVLQTSNVRYVETIRVAAAPSWAGRLPSPLKNLYLRNIGVRRNDLLLYPSRMAYSFQADRRKGYEKSQDVIFLSGHVW